MSLHPAEGFEEIEMHQPLFRLRRARTWTPSVWPSEPSKPLSLLFAQLRENGNGWNIIIQCVLHPGHNLQPFVSGLLLFPVAKHGDHGDCPNSWHKPDQALRLEPVCIRVVNYVMSRFFRDMVLKFFCT